MPPKRTFFKYKEEDVVTAIEEISKGAKIRETCRKYNIPHTTVINKMKLRYPVQRKMGPPTILTTQEESLLKTWILAMAKKGFPVNKEMVVKTVKKIITEENRPNPFKDNTPGRKWFSSFLKRHPDIATRHAESINISRSLVTENALRKWHANLKEYLVAEDVADILQDPERIINADESGVWPSESPIKRNQKNRKRVRLPDAVNSSELMKYWKEKEKIKKEKEEKKYLKAANREKISKKNKKQETDSDEETPVSTRKVRRLRIYSDSDDDNVPLIVHKSIEVTQKPKKGDYVIVRYEEEYFPGIVENTVGKLYEISTMTFSAGNTFRWPEQCDKIWYQEDKIEEKIAIPTLANSRGFYSVPEMDKFMPKM